MSETAFKGAHHMRPNRIEALSYLRCELTDLAISVKGPGVQGTGS